MEPIDVLTVGQKYSKNDLANLLKQPNLSQVREGVASSTNSNSYFLFVDLEKTGKETRFHFDDFFEEDFFHWDSQTTQHIDTPKIQDVVNGNTIPLLFVRVRQKEKSKTLPFIYCGRLRYVSHEENTSKPVHIIYQNVDFDDFTENIDLLEVYRWKPSDAGGTTKSKIVQRGTVSEERKRKFRKPNRTERQGLVTSRVGQGFYRQQIIEKWDGKCAVSRIDALPILIASHIVRWSESNDEEKLDADNGILLSPLFDSLFDKHLISFDDDGSILISSNSSRISTESIEKLNMPRDARISITDGMLGYIRRHRSKFRKLESGDEN
ncbi:HNH endonuclease [Candidatus Lucifugimonas marina]|uniref:HNH endonuclease n=1 Tax=Candidatus Lucifugimonas marina TaxID=3038979 RepID=UPI00319D8D9D